MKALIVATLLMILAGCADSRADSHVKTSAALRDMQGYAIASCLTYQDSAYLNDQGDVWASVIVQRMHGNIDVLANIAQAVKKNVDKGNMAVIRSETKPSQDKALPILCCHEIIEQPAVHEAIQKAVSTLELFY